MKKNMMNMALCLNKYLKRLEIIKSLMKRFGKTSNQWCYLGKSVILTNGLILSVFLNVMLINLY